MTKILFSVLISFAFVSCGSNSDDDVYKIKSGEFASRVGGFAAAFPTEPSHTVIENQIGLDKFQLHLFRSTLGAPKNFNVEFYDYPEKLLKGLTDEQLYEQAVKNLSSRMSESFILEHQEPIVQHGLKGVAFQLEWKENATNKDRFILGRIFLEGSRYYVVTYVGVNDEHVDPFMDSFRLLKQPK